MSDVSEINAPAPPPQQFQDPSRRFLWIVVAVAVVLLTTLLTARPALRRVRTWRAQGLVAEAEAARAKGDWDAVGRQVQVVLRLAPREPAVLRLVARYCAHHRAPAGMDYWGYLATTPAFTRQDRLEWAAAALELGRESDATAQLAALAKENDSDPEVQRLTIRLLLLRQNRPAALAVAREAVRRNPQSTGPRLALGGLLLEETDAARRAEGREILWRLAQANGPEQIEALRLYAASPELSAEDIRRVLTQIGRMSDRSLGKQLALSDLRWRIDPANHSEIVKSVQNLAQESQRPEELSRIAEWLCVHGEFEAALTIVPRERIRKSGPLAMWHLVALAGRQRWPDFLELVGDPAAPLEPFRRDCLRALANDARGRHDDAQQLRGAAVAACRGEPGQLLDLIGYAERAGDARAALAAHTVLLNFPPLALKSAGEILRLVEQTGEPAAAIPAIRRVLEYQPENAAALNALAYLLALTGNPDPKLAERVRALSRQEPNITAYRVTLALTELRANHADAAMDLLEGCGLESTNAPTRWRVVYAAALISSRQTTAARGVLATLDPGALVAEERVLLGLSR